jgi:3-methyladenine DNA glycosylase AlkD
MASTEGGFYFNWDIKKTDFDLLKAICIQHNLIRIFFIQKAIGWTLREYAKTNPESKIFVADTNLQI